MSVQAIGWALKQDLPTATKFVLVALCNYADQAGRCWPSQATLAADTSMTDRTVRAHLKKLQEAGIIERTARWKEQGSRASDVYIIHTEQYRKEIPQCLTIPESDDTHTGNSRQTIPESDCIPYRKEIPGNRQVEPSIEPSSEPLSVSKKNGRHEYPPNFELLWSSWKPHKTPKGNKKEALLAWNAEVKGSDLQTEYLLAQAEAYNAECLRTDTNTKHVCRWIKYRGWEQGYDPPPDTGAMVDAALDELYRRKDEEDAKQQSADTGNGNRQIARSRIALPER